MFSSEQHDAPISTNICQTSVCVCGAGVSLREEELGADVTTRLSEAEERIKVLRSCKICGFNLSLC